MSIEDNPNIEEKSIVDDWKEKFTNSKDFKKHIGKAIKNMSKEESTFYKRLQKREQLKKKKNKEIEKKKTKYI